MTTFHAATQGLTVVQTQTAKCGMAAIIPRAVRSMVIGLMVVLGLSSCSTMRLAYQQAPNLAYWWIDGFVDLREEQGTMLEQDLAQFFRWHTSEELPVYIDRLKHWQTMAIQDITPAQACAQFDAVRAAYKRGAERSLAPLSRVAISLNTAQFESLARKHRKSNTAFEEDWLQGTKAERLQRRMDKAADRYEKLYGKLTPAQRKLLMALTQRSSFDPVRVQAERQRRQSDLTTSLKQAQADPTQAPLILRNWHGRVLQSPDAAYAEYSQTSIEEGCAQLATLHNSTSLDQRTTAVKTLKSYEGDFIALSATSRTN